MIKDKWLCPVGDEKHSQWHTDDEVGVYQVSHTGIFLEGTHRSLWRRRHGLLLFLLLHSTDPEQSRFEFRGTRFTGHRPTGVWGETRHSELHVNRFKLNISWVHEYTWCIKCILYCQPNAFRHLHCPKNGPTPFVCRRHFCDFYVMQWCSNIKCCVNVFGS